MKKAIILCIIFELISFGNVCAMARQPSHALAEQMNINEAKREEFARRQERLASFERQLDHAWEQAEREYAQQQIEQKLLENAAEGAALQ